MKKLKIRVFTFLLVLAVLIGGSTLPAFASDKNEPVPVSAGFENAIRNPGFEEAETEWSFGAGAEVTAEQAHSGDLSVRILQNEKWFSNTIGQTEITLEAGTYEFSFYYICENPKSDTQFTLLFDLDNNLTEYTVVVEEPSSDWVQAKWTLEIPESGTFSFLLGIVSCDDPVFVDDFSIIVPTEASLENGGFEEGLYGWDVINPRGMQISDTSIAARTGGSSLLFGGSQGDTMESYVTQSSEITSAGYYKLTAYVKAAYPFNGDGVCLVAVYEDGSGYTDYSVALSGSEIVDGWTEISCSIYVPDDYGYLSCYITTQNADCVFLIDDVGLKRLGDRPAGNLLRNWGYESGMTSWDLIGSPNITFTSEEKYAGVNSAKVQSTVNEGFNRYLMQSCNGIAPGKVEFSAYIKTASNLSGAGAILFVEALDADGNVIASANSAAVSNTNGAWQKLTTALTLPAGTKTISVKIGGLYYTGTFYVDNACLNYVD